MNFSSNGTNSAQEIATQLTQIVEDVFVKSSRFRVVDRNNFDKIYTEENLQKGEGFLDGLVVEQGKKLGAEFIITGNILRANAEPKFSTDIHGRERMIGYTGNIETSIKVIEVETGEIKLTEHFHTRGVNNYYWNMTSANREDAIHEALEQISQQVYQFIDANFPLTLKIYELEAHKKGFARHIVITGGFQKGLKIGQNLKIVEIQKIAIDGQVVERKKALGWATVVSVDDAHFSTCRVQRGGAEAVLERFQANPTNIYVVSGQKNDFFWNEW
ncbi:MAG: hypothetical protein OHK0038_07740 [Flammeovirgaceae bacterium]